MGPDVFDRAREERATMGVVTREEVVEIIVKELPQLLQERPTLRFALVGALSETFARQSDLQQVLEEIRNLRVDFNARFEVHSERMEEHSAASLRLEQRMEEHSAASLRLEQRMEEHSVAIRALTERMEEHSRRLDEHSAAILRLEQRMEEHSAAILRLEQRMEEHSAAILRLEQRMEEHSAAIRRLEQRMEEHSVAIRTLTERMEEHSRRMDDHSVAIKRLDGTIGALGARWGLQSEESFRAAMAGLLTPLGLRVERFLAKDEEGFVFGEPDQVELDVVVRNGTAVVVEIKSSVSRADVSLFERKAAFYEKTTRLPVARKVIVSPMVHPHASERAKASGIEVYTSGADVPA
jgi:hypothetical protein